MRVNVMLIVQCPSFVTWTYARFGNCHTFGTLYVPLSALIAEEFTSLGARYNLS
jgi:hypothetical protein